MKGRHGRRLCGTAAGGPDSECSLLPCQESDIKWASRWDTYLTMSDVQIHWFSIINSVVVVFFLSGEKSVGYRV